MEKQTRLDKKITSVEHFNVDLKVGLNAEQVKQRIDEGLTNKIPKHVSKSYWKIIYDNLVNFFNILLFSIAALMIVANAPITSYMFLVILIANISIGLVQDIKARRLIDKLRVVSYPVVRVLREGREIQIPANELVLSDIALLSLGDQIVADGTILDGFVEVNESILTGESASVKKGIGAEVLSGAYITSGRAKYRIDHLGKNNYAEKLQASARYFKKPKSEILKTINLLFKIIGFIVIAAAIALIVTYIVQGKLDFNDKALFQESTLKIAGSLVSMIPTGMYLLTSLTLAVGAIRLARRKMLVQELYCIENLARVDVLCLDKTGTITDGTMKVNDLVALGESKANLEKILHTLVVSTGDSNVTAKAIGDAYKDKEEVPYFSALPFNSDRKISAVMLKDGRSIVLGAREFIPHTDKNIDRQCEEIEAEGLRVLIIAVNKQVVTPETKLGNCEVIGILVLEDHIKEDAITNIEWFRKNGVGIRIISGDSPISVSAIAQKVGVKEADKFISLEGMSVEEVKKIANEYTVFGRVSPEQKKAIIESLKEAGHTVAMTGDGVNDILALKVADCSIAMGSGSDAAKNVSHLVAIDSNFSSLPDVVAEGRRVINNLQRTCSLFLVKTIFAVTMTFLFIILMWCRSKYGYPFTTNNMYVWELVTIGIGSLFLSLQPNNEKIERSFLVNILTRSVPAGITQFIIGIVPFIIMFATNETFVSWDTALFISVIAFSISSFIIFFRICMPFDIYRKVLFAVLLIFGTLLVVGDMFILYPNIDGTGFFKIDYFSLTSNNWWILPTLIIVAVPLYMGLETITVKLYDHFINKKEVVKNENF